MASLGFFFAGALVDVGDVVWAKGNSGHQHHGRVENVGTNKKTGIPFFVVKTDDEDCFAPVGSFRTFSQFTVNEVLHDVR